jgi:putative ABC transport system permease protein
MLDGIARDVRYALRSLAKSPTFTAVAVFTLALGIGANSAIYSLLDATLLRPLPYPDADRIVLVWGRFTGIGLPHDRNWVSAPEFKDFEAGSHSFAAIAAVDADSYNLTAGTTPIHVEGAAVSPAFFDVLGVRPVVGRAFTADEAQPGRDRVLIISHALWRSAFGGDQGVVGRTVRLNGQPGTIAGVMPAAFEYPAGVDVWKPLAFTPDDLSPNNRGSHGLLALARIKPTLSLAQARADMDSLTAGIIAANPQYDYQRANFAVQLTTLTEDAVGDVRSTLYLLMGAVALVLLIACANVANLQVVRASARTRELAVRAALGADRRRVIVQLLVESGLLAIGGGAVGLASAFWLIAALGRASEAMLPQHVAVALNPSVLVFTVATSLATVVVFGLAPAVQAASIAPGDSLKASARTTAASPASQRMRRTLVAAEVALSLVLLAGAGLLGRSLLRLLVVDPGFRSDGILTFRVALPDQKYPADASRRLFYRQALDRVRALPGVQSAGSVNILPLSGSNNSGTVTIDTTSVPPDKRYLEADWRPVLPGYFETMGVRLIAGRFFSDADTDRSEPSCIVDETMARTFWPGDSAVGRRLKIGGPQSTSPWRTIVGVVGHVRYRTLEQPSRVAVYWPQLQRAWPGQTFVLRTAADPATLRAAAEREIQAVDPDQPVYAVRTMNEVMAASVARRRFATLLLGAFAGVALLLATLGVYGLTAYAVAERSQELGIRMALGANPRAVVASVVGRSLLLALAGIGAGLVAAIALGRLVSSMLFDTTPADPLTFAGVAALLIATAFVASYAPARRAARIDPAITLRSE